MFNVRTIARVAIVPMLLLSSIAASARTCKNPNDPNVCIVEQSPVKTLQCSGDVKGYEVKFVCKTGRNAGQGWDIWCRSSDGLCNLSEHEVCPQGGGLTQWHLYDHCTQGGAQPNWPPPPDNASSQKKKK